MIYAEKDNSGLHESGIENTANFIGRSEKKIKMNRQIALKLSKFIIYHCFQMSVSLNYSLHCGLWQMITRK